MPSLVKKVSSLFKGLARPPLDVIMLDPKNPPIRPMTSESPIGPQTSGLPRSKITLFLFVTAIIVCTYILLNLDMSSSRSFEQRIPDLLLPYPSAFKNSSSTTSLVTSSLALSTAMVNCQIPDLDPFEKSVAKWFSYKPYAPCSKWESPFQVHPPNQFQMKHHLISTYQKRCQLNALEGQKFKEESEIEAEGPRVIFETHQKVTVNASAIRIMCTTVKGRSKEYFFLHLPYRPPALATLKESRRKPFQAPGNKTISS